MLPDYRCFVLADSISPDEIRLTTLQIRFPRIVLAEFNTHRMLSRNSASSRAIPVEKRIAAVRADPFVPSAFGANQRGMQAGGALYDDAQVVARGEWMRAAADACMSAERLAAIGVHKQWANRLIEPFGWHEVIVTATEWSNFFHLRISEHAQPEIRAAAEAMKAAMDASTPEQLDVGDWHLPLVILDDSAEAAKKEENWLYLAKLSVARCARVSYLTHDGKRDLEADIRLHDSLLTNGHMSPFEHAAVVGRMDPTDLTVVHETFVSAGQEFIGNFRAPWVQYRKLIPRESDKLAPGVS